MVHALHRPRTGLIALIVALLATIPLALAFAGSAHAQAPEAELISVVPAESGELTVVGRASASVENDEATISLTVTAVRPTALDAVLTVNAAMDDVISAVMAQGVTADDLATANVSLRPEYEFSSESGRQLVGIRFSNSLLVTVTTIDDVGAVLDAAITAGGDLLELNRVSFSVADAGAVEDQVRLAAAQNAIDKAVALAGVLNIDLGHPISVREIGFSTPFVVEEAVAFDSGGAAAPAVFAGDSEITVSIEVVFQTWPKSDG